MTATAGLGSIELWPLGALSSVSTTSQKRAT